jgi:hypothetical protein
MKHEHAARTKFQPIRLPVAVAVGLAQGFRPRVASRGKRGTKVIPSATTESKIVANSDPWLAVPFLFTLTSRHIDMT